MDLPKQIELLFRENSSLAIKLSEEISKLAPKVAKERGLDKIKIMNFCGSHEWTTTHYGLRALMPKEVELIPGPGCPVCVTPSSDIENVIKLAMDGYRVYTFGDVFKLPTVNHYKKDQIGSLAAAKAAGADVRIAYSFVDAIEDAKKDNKPSVFFGVGFETTTPSYAVLFAKEKVPKNMLFYSSIKLTAPAAEYAVKIHKSTKRTPVSGVIGPGHVSTIIGAISWDFFPKEYKIPAVVSGFEPIDILVGVLVILKDLYTNEIKYTNLEYKRVAKPEGNLYAQEEIREVFDVVDAIWRGIGAIPKSGLDLNERFSEHNAKLQLGLKEKPWDYDLPPGCKCNEVTLGVAYPDECPLFMKACTPARPWGPCMVSMEGACAVWARFGSSQRVLEALKEVK
ncbi:MAG: hydrogenase formation protein HypD [Candidatus Aramenus sulfurataquae]|jgi:hydrogenase expression/formation protein HypD|uniref:Hydrogenase formation protein HypD n=4 Tax=Candidatus Aramenus sulfurataquae TaxID=1326980 RepID=A0AAE3K5N4_9CREN|nr:hydrogenase formation protein HypD [Candidatus Aramenus sulfurataquae]